MVELLSNLLALLLKIYPRVEKTVDEKTIHEEAMRDREAVLKGDAGYLRARLRDRLLARKTDNP